MDRAAARRKGTGISTASAWTCANLGAAPVASRSTQLLNLTDDERESAARVLETLETQALAEPSIRLRVVWEGLSALLLREFFGEPGQQSNGVGLPKGARPSRESARP